MENDKTAVESFLGELDNKDQDIFNQDSKILDDTTVTPKEEVVEEVKPLPFNKDPKVQKFIEKEISKRLAEFKPEAPAEKTPAVDDDYYVRLIGNDTPEKVAMIKEAIARDERMLQQAEERAFNRLSQREQEEVMADKQAEEELENAFDAIEENYDVDITSNNPQAVKTRQEFVSFVEKIAPKDRNGDIVDYPDMQSSWETFQEMKKSTATPSRAKELANRSMAKSTETTNQAPERMNWNKVDEFMDKL